MTPFATLRRASEGARKVLFALLLLEAGLGWGLFAQTDMAILRPRPSTLQRVLQAAGLSVDLDHTTELLSGDSHLANTPLVSGLSQVTLHWTPPGNSLFKGTLTAHYAAYTANRDSQEADVQGISNLTAARFHEWNEFYCDIPLGKRGRFKAGKVDANTEFSVIVSAANFSNSSLGVSPTLFTMPSYPNGALSANLFLTPTSNTQWSTGVYRTRAGGLYAVTEGSVGWQRGWGGRLAAGYWHRGVETDASGRWPATGGAYLIAEQALLRLGGQSNIRGFVRVSGAERAKAPASAHTAYGLTWDGIGKRTSDSMGFAVLDLAPVSPVQKLRHERAFELFYLAALNRHVSFKMDLQRVQNPAGLSALPAMNAASARLILHWSTRSEE